MSSVGNPYEAQRSQIGAVGVRSGLKSDLRNVAVAQKGVLLCILFQLVLIGGQFAVPPNVRPFVGMAALVIGLANTVFVFMLAIRVYNVALGVVLGILAQFPCLGLIVLLAINSKATSVLKANGYKVGLLGADLSRFPRG